MIFALDGKLVKNCILFTLFEHPPNLVQKPLPILVMDLLETCIIFTCIPPQEGVESHLRGFLFKMFQRCLGKWFGLSCNDHVCWILQCHWNSWLACWLYQNGGNLDCVVFLWRNILIQSFKLKQVWIKISFDNRLNLLKIFVLLQRFGLRQFKNLLLIQGWL